MPRVPIKWSFKRNVCLHTLDIKGTCNVKGAETILLGRSITWIEQAISYFHAILIPEYQNDDYISAVTVTFKLAFTSENDILKFLAYIESNYNAK